MIKDDKMWYSIQEALSYLNIDENTLYRKMTFFNMESRTLPGLKGEFISKRDIELLQRGLSNPGSIML